MSAAESPALPKRRRNYIRPIESAPHRRKLALDQREWLVTIAAAETTNRPVMADVNPNLCGNRRLTEMDVVAIRASGEKAQVIADRYGVARTCIVNVQLGATWKHVPGARQASRRQGVSNVLAKVDEATVRSIYLAQGTNRGIAKRYAIGKTAVGLIRQGKTWRHVTKDLPTRN